MITIGETELQQFRALIMQELGLAFDDHRREFLAGVLRERLAARRGGEPAVYLHRLAGPGWPDEWPALAGLLTVTETYFFRGREHFDALLGTVLPEWQARNHEPRGLRLLSAGCASGEEAYTLAIILRELAPWLDPGRVEITGFDANREMLAKARAGRYSAWSLRETPPAIREKYFRAERQEFVLDESVRAMVAFEERNLAAPDPGLGRPRTFDAVFCRNLLMYFASDAATALVARLAQALAPDGFLFLGHAETLRGLSQAFHLRRSHGAFYYQLRDGREAPAPVGTEKAWPAPAPAGPEETAGAAAPWFEEIGRASARIATLTAAAPAVAAPPSAGQAGRIDAILDLHRQERFADALAHLREMPSGPGSDPDLQVLQAVLLVNCGRLAEAEALCRPLLGRDDLNAGAHYVAALCREHAGALAAAEEHDAAAAYLDPLFAMPRFHLALMCKRQGRTPEARTHFSEALALLMKEDPVRLLLFGGGFARETLVQVCRSEIQRLGGAP